jgi:hypothetical protein
MAAGNTDVEVNSGKAGASKERQGRSRKQVKDQSGLTQNPQWKRSINPNRLIHIHLWPRRHGVLKDISFFPEREI